MPTKIHLPPNPLRPVIILHLISYSYQPEDNVEASTQVKASRPGRPPLKKPAITKNRPVDLGSPIESPAPSPNAVNGSHSQIDTADASLPRSPQRILPPSPSSRFVSDGFRNSFSQSSHGIDRSPGIRNASRVIPVTPEQEWEHLDDVRTRDGDASTPVHFSRKRKATNDVGVPSNSPSMNGHTAPRRSSPIDVDEYDGKDPDRSSIEQPQKIRRLGPVAVEALLS